MTSSSMALRLLHRRRGKKTEPTEQLGLLLLLLLLSRTSESFKSSKPRREEDDGDRVPQISQAEFLYVFRKVQALHAHLGSSFEEIERGEGVGRGVKQIMQLSF